MAIQKKRIIITNRKYVLTSRGNIITPISSPYDEFVHLIFRMISNDAEVYEVLPSGEKIRLTLKNFDKDNSKDDEECVTPVATQATTLDATLTPEEEEYEEEVDTDEEEVVEQPQQQRPQQQNQQYNNKKNKNKYKQNNQQQQKVTDVVEEA